MEITNGLQDEAVLEEVRLRMVRLRLERNWTQLELAEKAGVSNGTVQRIEAGLSIQLTSFLRLLRALALLQRLELVLPELAARPLEALAEEKPKQRASSPRKKAADESTWVWGDDE